MLEHNMSLIPIINMEQVESYTTEEILKKLWDYGITITKEQFLQDIHSHYSVDDLIKNWEKTYTINPKCFESDFIWMAPTVLWKRLAPEKISSEQIEDLMEKGYEFFYKHEDEKACRVWLEAYDHLKVRFRPEIKRINDFDDVFKGSHYVLNWSQDFIMTLWNAGLHQKQIEICQEFLNFFPESDDFFIHNVLRHRAESLFALDKIIEGENAFKVLVKKFPDNPWGYIGWGDQYSNFLEDFFNYNKAKILYLKGLEKDASVKDIVLRRIGFLEVEKKRIKLKEDLLLDYVFYLSEKKLSKPNIEQKKGYIEKFLTRTIIYIEDPIFQEFIESLHIEQILRYLGFWSIKDKILTSKFALTKLCRSVKSFILFLQDSYKVFTNEEMKEIKQVFNSKDFFIECLEDFNAINKDNKLYEKKFQEWSSKHLEWRVWYEKNKENNCSSKKIRLSKKKRALFKDIL